MPSAGPVEPGEALIHRLPQRMWRLSRVDAAHRSAAAGRLPAGSNVSLSLQLVSPPQFARGAVHFMLEERAGSQRIQRAALCWGDPGHHSGKSCLPKSESGFTEAIVPSIRFRAKDRSKGHEAPQFGWIFPAHQRPGSPSHRNWGCRNPCRGCSELDLTPA